MKRNIILTILVLTLLNSSLHAQQSSLNQRFTDPSGNTILLGKCTPAALQEAPFSGWFSPAYAQYRVDSATCQFVAPLLRDKQITIFLGTWCGDSRREVPRILKILDCCGFPPQQLTLVMVSNQPDAYKRSPGGEESGRKIQRVPTIIIEKANGEVGRIVEFPVVSLEKDMLSILRGERYIPQYAEIRQDVVTKAGPTAIPAFAGAR